jgi:AbrB family looped-hinge helix DNA binding protein
VVRYSKPVWKMIEEAVDRYGEITAKDAKDYIKENYSKDKVNELTINAQVIAASVNHPSAHHYSASHRFLFYLGNGRFRRYDAGKDGNWDITPTGATETAEEIKTSEASFSQIDSRGQVQIPREIRERLRLADRDFVAFVTDKKGNIILKKAELRPI